MSNPVTNVEIEDVLSSIRRLVAEGDKDSAGAPASDQTDTAPAPQAEKFVLTPALRVAETIPEDPVFSAESEALAAQFVAPAPEPLLLEPSLAADTPLVHDAMSEAERASLEATIAELEAAVTDPSDEWEPDGSEVGATAAPSSLVEMFQSADGGDIVEHDDIEEIVEDDDIDAPEAEVVTLHAEPEPTFRHAAVDDTPDADYGDELAADADDDGIPIPDDLDESIAAYLAGGSRIDQDMLREMVTQAVREELNGEMGERITRNIRKLVRREIANALSSKTIS